MTLKGPADRLVFDACVAQMLLPALRPGDIVVAGNPAAHGSP